MLKTIKIHESTHARLQNQGKKGDTFDEIISRLITEVESARD